MFTEKLWILRIFKLSEGAMNREAFSRSLMIAEYCEAACQGRGVVAKRGVRSQCGKDFHWQTHPHLIF